ncbi:MAG: hypothetical protein FWE28_08965 [Oscillospiraceae bacterium]|nr:hypothetical protein [Oscillospiraceae bacterium]
MQQQRISGVKIAMVYIGTVVGAGFATGQEVLQFFVAFGASGLWGILLSTVLFVGYGVLIMRLGLAMAAESHQEILPRLGGKLFQSAMDVLIMVSLFAALTAMLAGTGALFAQQFGMPAVLGNALMGVVTVLTVCKGLRGVIGAISAVVPFLLASVIAIGVFSLLAEPVAVSVTPPMEGRGLMGNWLWAAVLYGSYNILMSAAVLAPLGTAAGDRQTILRGGALGGIGLGAAALMIFLAITANPESAGFEVPMLHLAGQVTPLAGMLFSVVLLAEVYTTAVGSLYGFSARLQRSGQHTRLIVGTAGAAFLASLLGFSNLVRYLYPLQGYGGLVFLVALLVVRRPRQ